MEYTKKDLLDLERRLHERRKELLSIAETTGQAAKPVELDQTRVGRLSRMDALQVQAMAQASERRHQLELQRLAGALSRLCETDYGYCLTCGEAIGLPRLNVDPCATQCFGCALVRE